MHRSAKQPPHERRRSGRRRAQSPDVGPPPCQRCGAPPAEVGFELTVAGLGREPHTGVAEAPTPGGSQATFRLCRGCAAGIIYWVTEGR